MKSIQTKFVSLILSGILLSAVMIGCVGMMTTQKAVGRDSAMIMNLMCSENAKDLDSLLNRISQSVDILAAHALEQLDKPEKLSDDTYRETYTESLKELIINVGNDTDGAIAVYLRFNPEFTPPTAGFFWGKTTAGGTFEELAITDFSKYSSSDIEHVGWYYIPVEEGKPTWMAPYWNDNIDTYMISYVIPLYKDNTLLGVLGMDIDFEYITDAVEEIEIYDTGYAFLADEEGSVIYHKEETAGSSMSAVDESLSDAAEKMKEESSGASLINYSYLGQEKRMAFQSLSNGMRLVITAPASEIDKDKNELIFEIVLITVVICLIFIIITVRNTRSIIRPLKELNQAAKKIADGDLSVPLVHETKDEVGMLAESFRQTVCHLQKYMDYINSLAYRDAMTGVNNKTAYEDAVKKMEEKMRLANPQFAVVVFDVNGLKKINDTYGHDFGDMLIISACKLISKSFPKSPVYRIGGDEFAVILEDGTYENYPGLLEDFEQAMGLENKNLKDKKFRISIARGIAIYDRETDLTYADVFKRADKAMYANKASMKEKEKESNLL